MTDSFLEFPFFEQVPSHPPVPPDICRMEEKLAELEQIADAKVEARLKDEDSGITLAEILNACEDVVLAQSALRYLRMKHHGNKCTCDDDICNFCWHKSMYDKFLALMKGKEENERQQGNY